MPPSQPQRRRRNTAKPKRRVSDSGAGQGQSERRDSSRREGARDAVKDKVRDKITRVILFNKPYDCLSQFSRDGDRACLADFIPVKDVYPAGRLDRDSEGLLILTNDGSLQHQISHPKFSKQKTYWVQVENIPSESALAQLREGVELKDGITKPAQAELIAEPAGLWPRQPPVRFRANIPTQWLKLTITEGKNRQVRRMTAAVGHPTLRLIRQASGDFSLGQLQPGEWREL